MKAEALAVLEQMGLHEEEHHIYTPHGVDSTAAYIFSSRTEFYRYFIDNGLYLAPNQIGVAVIKEFVDGTTIASKWACDKIITTQKRRNDSSIVIDQTCGTCEFSLKLDDIKRNASDAGDEYYDTDPKLGSCCLGKTEEDQRRCQFHCDQYKPDYEAIESTYKVLTLGKKGRRVKKKKK